MGQLCGIGVIGNISAFQAEVTGSSPVYRFPGWYTIRSLPEPLTPLHQKRANGGKPGITGTRSLISCQTDCRRVATPYQDIREHFEGSARQSISLRNDGDSSKSPYESAVDDLIKKAGSPHAHLPPSTSFWRRTQVVKRGDC